MLGFIFLLILLIYGLDQVTKWFVVQEMSLYESITVIDGFFYITSHRNRGAAFGILQNQQWLFISITIIVVLVLFYYLWKMRNGSRWMNSALSLILGGALGNLTDRIQKGEVVDFFHFQFGSYHYPIFNVADSAIFLGVVIFILTTFKEPTQQKEEQVSKLEDS